MKNEFSIFSTRNQQELDVVVEPFPRDFRNVQEKLQTHPVAHEKKL